MAAIYEGGRSTAAAAVEVEAMTVRLAAAVRRNSLLGAVGGSSLVVAGLRLGETDEVLDDDDS